MAEEKARIQARIRVAEEEIVYLKEAFDVAPVPIEEREPIKPRTYWGSGRLHDGILIELGGLSIKPDNTGLLRIADDRSAHDGLEVWRFKSQIWKPMSWENSHRLREEEKLAKAEKRPVRNTPYPEPGIWDSKTDKIEYPDYDASTLKKCKKTNV